MFCIHCGHSLNEGGRFCASCGQITQKKEEIPHPIDKKEEVKRSSSPKVPSPSFASSIALKAIFVVAVVALCLSSFFFFLVEDPEEVIKGQLKALAHNNVTEAYFAFTSRDFQRATSLEDFKDFIHAHPILKSSPTPDLEDRFTKNKIEVLKGVLLSKGDKRLEIEYQLIKEGRQWKILNIQTDVNDSSHLSFLPPPPDEEVQKPVKEKFQARALKKASFFALADVIAQQPPEEKPSISSEDLHKTVDLFFGDLKEKKEKEAYDTLVSKEFQLVTSFQEFENFLNGYPVLSQFSSYELPKFELQGKVVFLRGTIKDQDDTVFSLEIQLVKEGADWKILHIQVEAAPPQKGKKEGPIPKKEASANVEAITKIAVGLSVDEQGKVQDPKEILSSKSQDIYLNVFYQGGKKGTLVTVLFKHDGEEGEITPVSAFYEMDGTSYLTFVFSPPKKGWPKGDYEIQVNSATGAASDYSFKVE